MQKKSPDRRTDQGLIWWVLANEQTGRLWRDANAGLVKIQPSLSFFIFKLTHVAVKIGKSASNKNKEVYMAVFAVLASGDPAMLESFIAAKLMPIDYHKVDERTWFVHNANVVTPKEMSDFLNISTGDAGRVLVLNVTSYYGFHSRDAWDWLTGKGV